MFILIEYYLIKYPYYKNMTKNSSLMLSVNPDPLRIYLTLSYK